MFSIIEAKAYPYTLGIVTDLGSERWIDLGGPVFFREWEPRRPGPDPGPTFVCLHGLGGSHLNWVRAAPLMAEHGRVVALDFPGSGRSPRERAGAGVAASREVLSRFIEEATEGPIVLCGNSLGGSIALLQAAVEPQRLSGVVLLGAALPPARGRRHPAVVLAGTAVYAQPALGRALGCLRLRALPPEALIDIGFRIVLADPSRVPDEIRDLHVQAVRRQQADPDAVGGFAETTRSILSLMRRPERGRDYLGAVRTPVLMIHGARDRVVPLRATLAAAPASWDRRVWEDAGHVMQLELPERVAETVAEWVAGLAPGPEPGRPAASGIAG